MKRFLGYLMIVLAMCFLMMGCGAAEEQTIEQAVDMLEEQVEEESIEQAQEQVEEQIVEQAQEQIKEIDEVVECEPVYVTLGPPPPVEFSQAIADIIESNEDLLLVDHSAVQLPDCYSVFAVASGILGGEEATAVAVERYPGDWSAERTLYILLADANGNYVVQWQGGNLGGRAMGGIWGDSFDGISFRDDMLRTSLFGGSSSRWGYDADYIIADGRLILYRLTEISFSTHAPGGTEIVFYPHTGIIETHNMGYNWVSESVYVSNIVPSQIFTFEEPLPDIWRLKNE